LLSHSPEEAPITRKLSVDEACSLAGRLIGFPVTDAAELPAFAGNQVFRVRRDALTAFLKLADGPDLRREVAVLQVLGPLGVPVPLIEAADPSGDLAGVACVLLREVSGEPADCASPGFTQAGQALRHVHGVMLDGYGTLTASSEGLRGEDRSWADAIARRTDDLGQIAESGLVDARLLDQAAAAIGDRRNLLAGAEGGHLLHGDFNPRHVFSSNGRMTGIIDWGDAICGDPVYDLGRVLHSAILERDDVGYGLATVNRLLDTYGDAPWLQGDLAEPLLVYAVVFILWSMRGELAGGAPWPPWWPAQAAALSAILDAL
jgi:aminoglycoside phosphotransferase (APT) family kinase protein